MLQVNRDADAQLIRDHWGVMGHDNQPAACACVLKRCRVWISLAERPFTRTATAHK